MNIPQFIHIFRAGRHTTAAGADMTFSEQDLKATAEGYDPALHEAPLVIGHPQQDNPAYGWVQSLMTVSNDLVAAPHQIEPAFAEMVKAGRYKKISAAFYPPDSPSNPKPGIYYLRHVGFLGAQPPAVKGLKQVQFQADDDFVLLEFAEDDALWSRFKAWLSSQLTREQSESFAEALSVKNWGDISASDYKDAATYCAAALVDLNEPGKPKMKDKCHLPVREPGGALNREGLIAAQNALVGGRGGVDLPADVKRAAARKLIALMKEHKVPPAQSLLGMINFNEENVMNEEELRAQQEQLKIEREAQQAKEAEFAEREQKLQAQETTAKRKSTVEFVEGLVNEGKVLPRHRDGLIAFMVGPNDKGVIEFKEDDEDKSIDASAWLKDFLCSYPKQVDFTEAGNSEKNGKTPARYSAPNGYSVDPRRLEQHNQILAYAEEHKVEYVAAAQALGL